MNVEGQILEDLSINPEAYHTRLPSSIVGAPHSIGASCDMDCAASHSSTVAEAQLQGLLAHAKQVRHLGRAFVMALTARSRK